MIQPDVSVVIPTLNAENRIGGLIELLQTQSIKPKEILVIDSSSVDKTVDIARSYGNVIVGVIDRSDFNHGTTRHEALLKTSSEFVCFLTDDAIPANARFLELLVAPLQDDEVAMASGRQLPRSDARRFEQLVRGYNYSVESDVRTVSDLPRLGIKTYFATDVCSVYRRSAYLAVGGFSHVNTNEDMLIASKFIHSGYKVAYAADAEVIHSHNLTLKQQFARNKEVGYFLESHKGELACPSEIGEGGKLVKKVSSQLLKEKNIREFFAFGLDCCARLAGNRVGRKQASRSMH